MWGLRIPVEEEIVAASVKLADRIRTLVAGLEGDEQAAAFNDLSAKWQFCAALLVLEQQYIIAMGVWDRAMGILEQE